MVATLSSLTSLRVSTQPTGQAVTTLDLLSETATGSFPFTAGMIFRKGDIPAHVVATEIPSAQWTTKNRWSDGSVKIGQLSGIAPLTAGVPYRLTLKNGVDPGGSHITTAALSSLVVEVAVSLHGTATFSGSDWASPLETWISGPVMSSWLYWKRINAAATWLQVVLEIRAYSNGVIGVLAALENGFVVNSAGLGGVRYGKVSLTVNGVTKYNPQRTAAIYDHARYVLAQNADGWHYTTTVPQIYPRPDTDYWMETRLVPYYPFSAPTDANLDGFDKLIDPFVYVDQNYWTERFHGSPGELPVLTSVGATTSVVNANDEWKVSTQVTAAYPTHRQLNVTGTWSGTLTAQVSTDQANWTDISSFTSNTSGAFGDSVATPKYYRVGFKPGAYVLGSATVEFREISLDGGTGSGGFHNTIGLLPRWDPTWLTSGGDPRAFRAVLSNAAALGIQPLHYRADTLDGALATWAQHPQLRVFPDSTTQPARFETHTTHHPGGGPLAYLITGDKFFLDLVTMSATSLGWAMTTFRTGGLPINDVNMQRMVIWEDSAFQQRGAAWHMRQIASAAMCAPDGHPQKQAFVDSIVNTGKFLYDAGLTTTTSFGTKFNNGLGVLAQTNSIDTAYGAAYMESYIYPQWMQEFQVSAIGYSWDMVEDNMTAQQKADYILGRDYAYRWAVGMAGDYPGGWPWQFCGTGAVGITTRTYLPPTNGSTYFSNFEDMFEHNMEMWVANAAAYWGGRANSSAGAIGRVLQITGNGNGTSGRNVLIWVCGKWANGVPQAWNATVKLQVSTDNVTYTDVPGKAWTANHTEVYNDGLTGQSRYYRLIVEPAEYVSGDVFFRMAYGSSDPEGSYPVDTRYAAYLTPLLTGDLEDCDEGTGLYSFTYGTDIGPSLYFANYVPGLVWAVDHGAPGASAAWSRLLTASNVNDFMGDTSAYRNTLNFGMRPR